MIILLIALNICHWLADYTHLSTKWMLDAKRTGTPLYPIFCHACMHGILMFFVLIGTLFFKEEKSISDLPYDILLVVKLTIFQVTTHFLIDLLKGKLNVWFPNVSNPINKSHWYIFGADQLAHQIIIILMVYFTI